MTEHGTPTYLVVGGGLAADAAIRALCEADPQASITLVSAEATLPFDRPALTKELITDPNETPASIQHDPEPYSEKVRTLLGRRVDRVEPEAHAVIDSEGERHSYDKLLLATGGRPRRLPNDPDHVLYYRTLSDFKRLQEDIALGRRVAVIGDGFIGGEIAASLSETACNPFMIFPHPHLGAERYPDSLARHLDEVYRDHGVDLLPNQRVVDVETTGDTLVLATDGNGRYAADHAVAGLGILPNVELALDAGLTVEDGIRVNERLQTSDPDIFAAGDNACVYREATGRVERVEHEMNAVEMGSAAGRAMSGDTEVSFAYTPLFYSDFFDLGFEAVGDLDASLDLVEDWRDGFDQGVVYYLEDRRVRGVLLWNLFGKTDEARALMREGVVDDPESLKGRIPIT